MNIGSELEKLISLRDRGDLTQTEFEKAKALLLLEEDPGARSAHKTALDTFAEKKKKGKTHLLVAVLLTVTATFSAGSAGINPTPIKIGIVVLWVVTSTLAWSTYSRFKKEIEKEEKSGLT